MRTCNTVGLSIWGVALSQPHLEKISYEVVVIGTETSLRSVCQ